MNDSGDDEAGVRESEDDDDDFRVVPARPALPEVKDRDGDGESKREPFFEEGGGRRGRRGRGRERGFGEFRQRRGRGRRARRKDRRAPRGSSRQIRPERLLREADPEVVSPRSPRSARTGSSRRFSTFSASSGRSFSRGPSTRRIWRARWWTRARTRRSGVSS